MVHPRRPPIPTTSIVLAFLFAGASAPRAQEPAALIEQLRADDTRARAIRDLLALGPKAIPPLTEHLGAVTDARDEIAILRALDLLARLGAHGNAALVYLLGKYPGILSSAIDDAADKEVAFPASRVVARLTRTITDLAMYGSREAPERLQADLMIRGLRMDHGIHDDPRFDFERLRHATARYFGSELETKWLVEHVADDRPPLQLEVAVYCLSLRGAEAAAAIPRLVDLITRQRPRPEGARNRIVEAALRTTAARALVAIAPTDPRSSVGHAHRLLHDEDIAVRVQSARSIAAFGPDAAPAASLTARALRDEDPRVVAEAITALGAIGPAARNALDALRAMTKHENAQVRMRATVAVRQIEE